MWKKLACVLFAILMGVSAFAYIQLHQWEDAFKQQLAKQPIRFSQFHVHIFPQPSVIFEQFQYKFPQKERSFLSEFFEIKLDPWALLRGKIHLASLNGQHGEIWHNAQMEPDWQAVNFHLQSNGIPLDLTDNTLNWQALLSQAEFSLDLQAQDPQHNHIHMQSDFSLTSPQQIRFRQTHLALQLAKLAFFKQNTVQFQWEQGQLTWQNHHYQLDLHAATLNQQPFNINKITISLPNPQQQDYVAQLFFADQGELQINLRPTPSQLHIDGKKLLLAPWLNAFAIPQLVDGTADISALLNLDQLRPIAGQADVMIHNGNTKGINLLDLISQYLPINYDKEQLQNKNIDTPFDRLQSHFSWVQQRLDVAQITLFHPYFIAQGQGHTDLQQAQCDYQFTLAPTHARYQGLSLPVHFFGNCASPQYEVLFKQDLRHQLKNLLKEKWKSY